MTNYLTGSEVTQVTDAGGDILQLGVDGAYSMFIFGIDFITANFLIILLFVAITVVARMGYSKVVGAGKGSRL